MEEITMGTENLQTNYEINATTLQNLQNQNNVQESSTWVEWGYWYYAHGKIVKNVYELSKVVSPEQTIRQIATYTVGPLARKIDETTGLSNANFKLLGYEIPCSFSTFGTLATETLVLTVSPAQWAASRTFNLISNYFGSQAITKLDLKNRGTLGREAAAAIQIGSTLIGQKALEKAEKCEIVGSTYKKVDGKLKYISKPIDTFVNQQISNGLEKLGVDTTQPLGLTRIDIEREKKLIASEEKVADIEEKLQNLKLQEERLQEQAAQQEKLNEQNHLDADRIIKKAREYERDCPERKTMHKYEKHRKYNKVWAKQISEEFVTEFNISEQQRSQIQEEIVRKLHHKGDEKAQNKAMKKVIHNYKAVLQNKSKMQLEDVKRAHANLQYKLNKAKQQYESEKYNFEQEANVYQQGKYKNEQQERHKIRTRNNLAPLDTFSGNVQLTISPDELKELENSINHYFEENGYFKRNLNDRDIKVFLNGKVNIDRDSLGNLGLVVPIRIDKKRSDLKYLKGKVTQFNTEFHFNIQLADSSPEKLIDINIDETHKLTKKPHYKLFSTFKVARIGTKANEKLEPELFKAMSYFQEKIDEALLKDNILNQFNANLPEGVTIKPGIINVRPRVDSSYNQVFDIDFNADFQYQMSADSLKDKFTGYQIGGCCFEQICNIEMTNGRVKIEIPVSGAINGRVVGSFDLYFCPERQRFSFSNLDVASKNNGSSVINLLSGGVNCLQSYLLGPIESYINNNLENIRLSAINTVEQRLQEKIPGRLNIDVDSLTINNIDCNNNNITLDFSLSSNDSSLNQPI